MNCFWIFPDVWTRFTEVLLIYGRQAVAGFDSCPFVWMKADVMLGKYFFNISCDYISNSHQSNLLWWAFCIWNWEILALAILW